MKNGIHVLYNYDYIKPISSNQYADLNQERLIGGMNT